MREFERIDDHMVIGGLRAVDLAEEYGTPVYVTDEDAVRENYRDIYGAI